MMLMPVIFPKDTFVMAKYARFVPASYGNSFMRVLGIDRSTDTLLKGSYHQAKHIHANLCPDDISCLALPILQMMRALSRLYTLLR
jgi:hypothetical protein